MKSTNLHRELKRHPGLPRGARILVAVSGGADSVALLHLLHEVAPAMQWRLGVAHLNHGLRGRHAKEDEVFVRELAATLKLRCHVRRKNVALLARRSKGSVEMLARAVRHAFLADVAKKERYTVAALAHTLDDQAETLLLRLMRGAGLAGLGAMEPLSERNALRIARPLLHVSKATLLRYLQDRGAAWREDASNHDVMYLRNRVRHELIPLMEERFNPKIKETLARTAALLREDHVVLHEQAMTDWAHCHFPEHAGALDARLVRALPAARRRRVLLLWLIGAGVDEAHVHADVIERIGTLCRRSRGSAEVPVQETMRAVRQYDRLFLSRGDRTAPPGHQTRYRLKVPGETRLPEAGLRVRTRWGVGFERGVDERCGRLPAEGYLSGSAVGRAAFYVRFWREGDRFAPMGMQGEKKVQDIFVNEKVPREQRMRIPLVECRRQIVWMPGYRVARGWAVPGKTDRSLHIIIEPLAEAE